MFLSEISGVHRKSQPHKNINKKNTMNKIKEIETKEQDLKKKVNKYSPPLKHSD